MDRLEELIKRIDKFNKDRDWDQFHTPTNLAKSISIEANELLSSNVYGFRSRSYRYYEL